MKRNVDLTQNRTFRDETNVLTVLKLFPWDDIAPWRKVTDESMLHNSSKELLFTGDCEERQIKRMAQMYDVGGICECCGKDINARPWKRVYSLCIECYENHIDPHQFPWGMER